MFRLVILTAFLACGIVPQLDGRIFGGFGTEITTHTVSLRYGSSNRCEGSIYGPGVIITAAHCVEGVAASGLTVVAETSPRTGGGISRTVSRIVMHSSNDSATTNNSIALLLLDIDLPLGDFIKAIPLATSDPAAGTSVLATLGSDTLREGVAAVSAVILQVVTGQVVDNTQCPSSCGNGRIASAIICVSGKDASQVDSGSPLITGGRLVGIALGNGCPGVYLSVAALRSWIESNS